MQSPSHSLVPPPHPPSTATPKVLKKSSTALRVLNLSDNPLEELGAKNLAAGVAHNRTLTTLVLSGCNILDQGACDGCAWYVSLRWCCRAATSTKVLVMVVRGMCVTCMCL